jgi:hypothetical protein
MRCTQALEVLRTNGAAAQRVMDETEPRHIGMDRRAFCGSARSVDCWECPVVFRAGAAGALADVLGLDAPPNDAAYWIYGRSATDPARTTIRAVSVVDARRGVADRVVRLCLVLTTALPRRTR